MRKISLLVLCAALALPAAAQSWDQGLLFSENNYGGTARSIGMGNALTAVGGDPGAITLNPAGGAVAGYSQFFLTPALSISASNTSGVTLDGELEPLGMADNVRTGYTRVKMPNMGFSINMETGRKHGLRRMSVGFVVNSVNDFTSRMRASGVNYGKYSYSGSLASLADGYDPEVLGKADWYATGAGKEPDWNAMVGFLSGMFDHVDGRYLGITDMFGPNGAEAAAPVYQTYGYQTKGYKQDVLLNISANFSDRFYVGANMGITSLAYGEVQYWEEMPENAETFPVIKYNDNTQARFNSLLMKRMYDVSGTGIYFKAGLLWRPFAGLRLGAAIQTPTIMSMTGRCQWYGETNLAGKTIPSSKSPEDQWYYSMVSPFRWNVGLAYSFGSFAVLSADYEWANFRHVRYGGRSEYSGFLNDSLYEYENADIKDALGISHQFRVGMEFKPMQDLAIRVGYNYTSSAQRNWVDYVAADNGAIDVVVTPLSREELAALGRTSVSFGAGYAFGAFYTDLAVRLRFLPDAYYIPYSHYVAAGSYETKVADYSKETPTVKVKSMGIDAVFTVGWRF